MRRDQTGIAAQAIKSSHTVVVLPGGHPSLGFTLDVVGYEGQGWQLRLNDPAGTTAWECFVEGEGADPVMSEAIDHIDEVGRFHAPDMP